MWDDAYPGAVQSVRVVRDSRALPGLLNKAFNLAKEVKALEEQQAALDDNPDDDAAVAGDGAAGGGGGGGGGEMGTKEARASDLRANLEVRLADALAEHEKAAAAASQQGQTVRSWWRHQRRSRPPPAPASRQPKSPPASLRL